MKIFLPSHLDDDVQEIYHNHMVRYFPKRPCAQSRTSAQTITSMSGRISAILRQSPQCCSLTDRIILVFLSILWAISSHKN